MKRDEPECILIEFDKGERYEIRDFYFDGCNVVFEESKEFAFAYDYDDPSILCKTPNQDEAYYMNLLFARENLRYAYDQWFALKGKTKAES